MPFELRPLCHAVGAEVLGVDCTVQPDTATAESLMHAVSEHGVLLFRGQALTPEQHIAFSAALGEVIVHPADTLVHPDYPEIFVVTNLPEGDRPSRTRHTGRTWHSDTSFVELPAMGSLLYCLEHPPVGGDTMFANQYLAYETLSETMKSVLEGLRAVHDLSLIPNYNNRSAEEMDYLWRKNPPVVHPVVRTHPVTGRKALYVGPTLTDRFDGMTVEESKPLLDFLFRHAVSPEFTYRHAWGGHDMVFWDNRCVMHMAPEDYDLADPANRRLMYRTTLAGDRPY